MALPEPSYSNIWAVALGIFLGGGLPLDLACIFAVAVAIIGGGLQPLLEE